MQGFLSKVVQKASLDGLTATGGILHAATLMLFKNNLSVNGNTQIGDLVECDFDGYAAVAAQTFAAAYVGPDGKIQISAPSVLFGDTGATTPNTIYGWALVNAGKTALYYVEKFDDVLTVDGSGEGFLVQPVVRYGE